MKTILALTIYALSGLYSISATANEAANTPTNRVFEFTYEILDTDLPNGEAIDIYLPIPAEHAGQRIVTHSVETSLQTRRDTESAYGNAFYHLHRPANSNEPVQARLQWTVSRDRVVADGATGLSESEKSLYLEPNELVPVGHEVLRPILKEIREMRAADTPEATARAIYDWVVDNVEYKKVGTGWGNGDTFWACSERYGNCTDFHALFISLARSEGIPARFEIGFPVPMDRSEGEIGGYHCWVQFYLPGRGWVPIDASEAAKHPELREQLYGSHPADRIHFTTGRDLQLTASGKGKGLNYFIYPYVEIAGQPWDKKIATRFSFKEVPLALSDNR